MFVFLYINVCISIYICLYFYIYMFVFLYICLYFYIHVCISICKYSSTWALSLCGHKRGGFKHRKTVSFQISLCSDPHLWSWILGNDWKNTVPSKSGRDGILRRVHGVKLNEKVLKSGCYRIYHRSYNRKLGPRPLDWMSDCFWGHAHIVSGVMHTLFVE